MYGFLLFFYLVLTNIIMMDVLSALLVQAIKTMADTSSGAAEIKAAVSVIGRIWDDHFLGTTDSNPVIALNDLPFVLSGLGVPELLHQIQVDCQSIMDVAEIMSWEGVGRLSKTGFVRMVLDTRGGRLAKAKDCLQTQKLIHVHTQEILSKL